MFLSRLSINVGTNPDRPRPGRLWLRNVYHVHQRLCMAFPSAERRESDPEFVLPYAPAEFARQQVHVPRGPQTGFLFRVEPRPGGKVEIVVLSAVEPDWEYAFHNAGHLLAEPPGEPNPFDGQFEIACRLRYSLLANPVFRAREKSLNRNGQAVAAECVGKRLAVPTDDVSLRNWLERRAADAGFRVLDFSLIQTGYVHFNKTCKTGVGQRFRSVRYEGLLEVTDSVRFAVALTRGIGPAKAFGFGLITVARAD